MTKIYYVRHAEPNYKNYNDSLRELTPKGRKDVKLVTEFLADKDIDLIVSSPYKRAIDTIGDFAKKVSLDIKIEDDFRERKVGDDWLKVFPAYAHRQWSDFYYKLENGECLQEVQDRNIRALKKLLDENKGKNIVIAGHGTALSTIINYFDKSYGYENFMAMVDKMPWIVEFDFDNEGTCLAIKTFDLY